MRTIVPPSDNAAASKLAICRYGAQSSDDGIPDGYRDRILCADGDEAACFAHECGQTPSGTTDADWADKCQTDRCTVSTAEFGNCEWFRDRLTPVDDYYDFLNGLKAEPIEQLIVAGIVGHRSLTELGNPFTFNPITVAADPDCVFHQQPLREGQTDPELSEACCPGGECIGYLRPSCNSANGEAYSGRRYNKLIGLFDTNGIGCPEGPDGAEECVHICTPSFSAPLIAIKDRVIQVLGSYCLDKTPACQVPPMQTDDGVTAARACETAAEYADGANYSIRVRLECLVSEDQGGRCAQPLPSRIIPSSDWIFEAEPACPGGFIVKLNEAPAAGSDVTLEFLVEVSANRPPVEVAAPDAGADPEPDAAQ